MAKPTDELSTQFDGFLEALKSVLSNSDASFDESLAKLEAALVAEVDASESAREQEPAPELADSGDDTSSEVASRLATQRREDWSQFKNLPQFSQLAGEVLLRRLAIADIVRRIRDHKKTP